VYIKNHQPQHERKERMNNPVLEDIKDYAAKKLMEAYGFCGIASGDDMAMLNSSDREGMDIKINIEAVPE